MNTAPTTNINMFYKCVLLKINHEMMPFYTNYILDTQFSSTYFNNIYFKYIHHTPKVKIVVICFRMQLRSGRLLSSFE